MKHLAFAAAALIAVFLLAAPAPGSHLAAEANSCGNGEPAYTGWNYFELRAYRVACSNARRTAEEYVYDFSTEGVIEPPRHWDRCKDKRVERGLWKGKCARVKGNRRQKITFLFGGPEQPWYPNRPSP